MHMQHIEQRVMAWWLDFLCLKTLICMLIKEAALSIQGPVIGLLAACMQHADVEQCTGALALPCAYLSITARHALSISVGRLFASCRLPSACWRCLRRTCPSWS
jgi:hypothetical protein